jgi:hypothetical protein
VGSFEVIEEDPAWERLAAHAEHVWGEKRLLINFTFAKLTAVSPEPCEAHLATLLEHTKLTCW